MISSRVFFRVVPPLTSRATLGYALSRFDTLWLSLTRFFSDTWFKKRFSWTYPRSTISRTPLTDIPSVQMSRLFFIVSFFCLNGALFLGYAPLAYAATLQGFAHVIDGDTLVISGTRIRLAGIDAPERGQSCGTDSDRYSCGLQAKKELHALTKHQIVACHEQGRDKHGRVIATCGTAQTPNINAEMVKRGWAVSYYGHRYRKQERQAKAQKKGIWRSPFQQPQKWRHTHQRTKASKHPPSLSSPSETNEKVSPKKSEEPRPRTHKKGRTRFRTKTPTPLSPSPLPVLR